MRNLFYIVITLFMTVVFTPGCKKTSRTVKPFNELSSKEQKSLIQTLSNDVELNIAVMTGLVSSLTY